MLNTVCGERLRAAILTVIFAVFALAGSLAGQNAPASHNGTPASGNGGKDVQVEMHNVMYHFTNTIAVHIRNLQGELAPVGENQFPVFDDKNSFHLDIHLAEIAITPAALAEVLNSHVLNGRDAPVKNIAIQIENNKLKIKGKLHSKGDIPFETVGTISATPEGKIRVHTEKVKALHLPVKGLMDLFGVDLADLIKNGKIKGIQVDKDDLILDSSQILPPPQIQGKVTGVKLEGNTIVQFFGGAEKGQAKPSMGGNFMAYRGNRLRFGKLLMNDTDMILIDAAPKDPFDFSLDRYREQLTAGYVKTTPSMGLRVFMPDLNKMAKKAKGAVSN
jgi:hypothetical protein